MKSLRKDAEKHPITNIIMILLFAIGGISLPLSKLMKVFIEDTKIAEELGTIILRVVFSGIMIYFIKSYRFKIFGFTKNKKELLLIIPALVVAINNFPFIAVITRKTGIAYGAW